MRNRQKILILLVIVIGVIGLGNVVSRRVLERRAGDGVIITQDYSLSDTVNDPLVVIADTVALSGDSQVNGDAGLVGRTSVILAGQVSGDLAALGEDVNLETNAQINGDAALMGNKVLLNGTINGDLTVIGDTLTINPSAQVNGTITACVTHLADERSDAAPIQPCSDAESTKYTTLKSLSDGQLPRISLDSFGSGGLSSGGLLFSLSASLVMTGLAALVVTAFPRAFSHLTEALQTMPRRMAGMGCLTSLFAVGGSVILLVILADIPVVGLLLLPFGAIAGIVLLGMVIVGWIALALVIGSWIVNRLGSRRTPPIIAVALGSIALFLLWHILALLPLGGVLTFLLMTLLGTAGLGAAFTTRMGTRPLRRSYFIQG